MPVPRSSSNGGAANFASSVVPVGVELGNQHSYNLKMMVLDGSLQVLASEVELGGLDELDGEHDGQQGVEALLAEGAGKGPQGEEGTVGVPVELAAGQAQANARAERARGQYLTTELWYELVEGEERC